MYIAIYMYIATYFAYTNVYIFSTLHIIMSIGLKNKLFIGLFTYLFLFWK
jgi:hypothetical protein